MLSSCHNRGWSPGTWFWCQSTSSSVPWDDRYKRKRILSGSLCSFSTDFAITFDWTRSLTMQTPPFHSFKVKQCLGWLVASALMRWSFPGMKTPSSHCAVPRLAEKILSASKVMRWMKKWKQGGFHPWQLLLAALLTLRGTGRWWWWFRNVCCNLAHPLIVAVGGTGNIDSTDWSEWQRTGLTSQYHWPSKAITPGKVWWGWRHIQLDAQHLP